MNVKAEMRSDPMVKQAGVISAEAEELIQLLRIVAEEVQKDLTKSAYMMQNEHMLPGKEFIQALNGRLRETAWFWDKKSTEQREKAIDDTARHMDLDKKEIEKWVDDVTKLYKASQKYVGTQKTRDKGDVASALNSFRNDAFLNRFGAHAVAVNGRQ